MRFKFSRPAQEDIAAIGDWIARNDPVQADRFVEQIRQCCRDIAQFPEAFRIDPSVSLQGVRRRPFGRYVIFYRVERDRLLILAVLHSARDTTAILRARLR